MELTLDLDQTQKQRHVLNFMRLQGECCDARIVSTSQFVGTECFSLAVQSCVLCAASPILYKKFTELNQRHVKNDLKSRFIFSSPGISNEAWFLVLDFIYLGKATFAESTTLEVVSSFVSLIYSLKIVDESEINKIKKHVISHEQWKEGIQADFHKIVEVFMGLDKGEVSNDTDKEPIKKAVEIGPESAKNNSDKEPEIMYVETGLKNAKVDGANQTKKKIEDTRKSSRIKVYSKQNILRKLRLRKEKGKLVKEDMYKEQKESKEIIRHKCNICGKSFFMASSLEKHQLEHERATMPDKKKEYVMPEELFVNASGAYINPPLVKNGAVDVDMSLTKRVSSGSATKSDDPNEEPNEAVSNKIRSGSDTQVDNCLEDKNGEVSNKKEIDNVTIKDEPTDESYEKQVHSLKVNSNFENLNGIESYVETQKCVPIKIEPIEDAFNGFTTHSEHDYPVNSTPTNHGIQGISSMESAMYPSMENINILLEEHKQIAGEDNEAEIISHGTQTKSSTVLNVIDSIASDIKLSPSFSGPSDAQGNESSVLNVVESIGEFHCGERSPESPTYSFMAADDSGEVHVKMSSVISDLDESAEEDKVVDNQKEIGEDPYMHKAEEQIVLPFQGIKGIVGKPVEPGSGASYSCPLCDRKFFMFVSLVKHKCLNTEKAKTYYRCICCNKLVRASEVKNHIFKEGTSFVKTEASSALIRTITTADGKILDKGTKVIPTSPSDSSRKNVMTSMKNKKIPLITKYVHPSSETKQNSGNNLDLIQLARSNRQSNVKNPVKNIVSSTKMTEKIPQKLTTPKKTEGAAVTAANQRPAMSKSVTSEELFARLEQSVKKSNFPFTKITVVNPPDLFSSVEERGKHVNKDNIKETNLLHVQPQKATVSHKTVSKVPSVVLHRLPTTSGSSMNQKNNATDGNANKRSHATSSTDERPKRKSKDVSPVPDELSKIEDSPVKPKRACTLKKDGSLS